MSIVYVCHSLSFARYQRKPQIVSLCLWCGSYGSHNNIKGNLKYIVLPLSLRTIGHTLEYAPFLLWLRFWVGLCVNIIRNVAVIVAITILDTWSLALIYECWVDLLIFCVSWISKNLIDLKSWSTATLMALAPWNQRINLMTLLRLRSTCKCSVHALQFTL